MSEDIPTKTCHTVIAACFMYKAGKPVMKALKTGDELILKREPTNPYDKDAIQVIGKDPEGQEVQLGYVPAIKAAVLARCQLVSCKKDGSTWDGIVIHYRD